MYKSMESQQHSDPRRRYLSLPTRIVNISNPRAIQASEKLLEENLDICTINTSDKPEGIILDFGTEIHGGIQILSTATIAGDNESPQLPVRVRLGESVSEVLSSPNNDHALNDIKSLLPCQSRSEFGQTGFRFANIEILAKNAMVQIRHIKAVCLKHPWPLLGSFECNDKELNQIWKTAVNTVHLCCQDHIWDGIKRDRVAWTGDMHPQLPVIACAFGDQPIVIDTLKFIADQTEPGKWINNIGSYSLWWIISLNEWYWYTGDIRVLKELHQDMIKICSTVLEHIDETGQERMPGRRFLDWPSHGKNTDIDNALQALCFWAIKSAFFIFEKLEDYRNAAKCRLAFERMRHLTLRDTAHNQTLALRVMAGIQDTNTKSSLLESNPYKDISPWFAYYILQARAAAGDITNCLDMIKSYWGGMLSLGATTFWEHFDIGWKENALRLDQLPDNRHRDVHKECGENCYTGHRHSLCHGWSGGPAAWLSRNILGIIPLEPGYSKIEIRPNLGHLTYAKGSFPTTSGIISVCHTKQPDGSIRSEVKAPESINIHHHPYDINQNLITMS